MCKNLNLVCLIRARERVLCVRERVFFLCGAVVCDGVVLEFFGCVCGLVFVCVVLLFFFG